QDDQEALQLLADRVIAWHYPDCLTHPAGDGRRYAAFLQAIGGRTARLLAHWQAVGFCHGVMNTDNMSILGLTLDYGPFQFLDAFQPGHICNHSDNQGRYAFDRQPQVAYWNLYCLARALLPLIGDPELAQAALEPYRTCFAHDFESLMLEKLGWTGPQTDPDASRQLVEDTLAMMARQQVDHTLFWRRLSRAVASQDPEPVRDLMPDRPLFDDWLQRYHQHGQASGCAPDAALMLQRNPKYVLRNHLAEIAIQKARAKDFSEVQTLQHLLETPFEEHPGFESYADLPPDWAASIEISCSS
ncbi:MAG: YdiU family protein, partial [Curvibacter sp.]|nr:YdiU family protein [Curvibacter sp.]